HRFAESIRAAKVAPTAIMLETGQPFHVTTAPDNPVNVSSTDLAGNSQLHTHPLSHAPFTPGFLTISQNKATLLDAAVYFADTREADFSACGASNRVSTASQSALERHTRPDPLWRVWIILLIAALLVSWKFNVR